MYQLLSKLCLMIVAAAVLAGCKFFATTDAASQVASSQSEWETLPESFDYHFNYRILTTSLDESERYTEGSRSGGTPQLEEFQNAAAGELEGSGVWGQDCSADGKKAPCGGASDHLSHAIFSRMADVGGGLGYTLAAEFFHHYLQNSGLPKKLSSGKMLQLAVENRSLKESLHHSGYTLVQPYIGLLLAEMQRDGVLRQGGHVPKVEWRTGTYFDDRPMYFAVGGARLHFATEARLKSVTADQVELEITVKHSLTGPLQLGQG